MSFLDQVKNLEQQSFLSRAKKLIVGEVRPAVYVGTYGKYNSGSIQGKWMYLDDYASYDDFREAAEELHKDEDDAELMFQDFEGFPKRYYGESSLDKDLWDWIALDQDDRDLLEVYIDEVNDEKATIEQARDAYAGTFKSEEDWAAEFIDEMGGLGEQASSYLMISDTDARLVAFDMVSSRVEDLNYDIERENYEDVFKSTALYEDEYEELAEKLEELEGADEENESEIEAVKKKIEDLAKKSIDEWESQEIDEIESKIKKDPVGYFVDEEGIYSLEDLAKANFMQIDYEAYARDARLGGDVSFVHKNGEVWVFWNH